MSKERAPNMHTGMLILYTVECALLFVTWMTLPLIVTATRRVPSGDHAIPPTFYSMVSTRQKREQTGTHSIIALRSVHFCLRGNVGDAEGIVLTASCHQSAVGGNRTPPHLQTQPASDQQHIKSKERRTSFQCGFIVAFLTS